MKNLGTKIHELIIIKTIMVDIRKYNNEDRVLKDFIETNIRQRRIGNHNPIKLGRCIKELERIYGIKNGNNQFDRSCREIGSPII